MLLIGGGDFEVEVVQVGVFRCIKENDIAGHNPADAYGAILCAGVDLERGMIGPGNLSILGNALDDKSRRQIVSGVIFLHPRIVEVDWN